MELKPTILIFWNKLNPKKFISSLKQKKSEHHHWILHIWINWSNKYQLKLTILIFWSNLSPKGYFLSKTEKSDHHYWILHILISVGTKFQLKLAILTFSTKITQKGYFQCKVENVNTTIESYMFNLVWAPNFSLNWQLWFFEPNLPKKSIFSLKQKKWTSPLNYAY